MSRADRARAIGWLSFTMSFLLVALEFVLRKGYPSRTNNNDLPLPTVQYFVPHCHPTESPCLVTCAVRGLKVLAGDKALLAGPAKPLLYPVSCTLAPLPYVLVGRLK